MKAQALNAAQQVDAGKQKLLKVTKELEDLRNKHEGLKLKLGQASTKIKELAGFSTDVEMKPVAVSAAQAPQPKAAEVQRPLQ